MSLILVPAPGSKNLEEIAIKAAATGQKEEWIKAQFLLLRYRAGVWAAAVLRLLEQRDLTISFEAREQLDSCLDIYQLEKWFDRALSATAIEDVFDQDEDDQDEDISD